MKRRIFSSIICLLFCGALYADSSKNTANHVRALAPELIGKKVSLDVAAVSPLHKAESEKYGFLIANTYDDKSNRDGGRILVVSDSEELIALVKKFGSSPDVNKFRRGRVVDTRRLTGVLRQTDNKVLFLDIAEEEIPEAELKAVKKALSNTAKKTLPVGKGRAKGK